MINKMRDYKSIHVVTYICSYEGKLNNIPNSQIVKQFSDSDMLYFDGFQKLFNTDMITKYRIDKLKCSTGNEKSFLDSNFELKVSDEYSICFDIDEINIYKSQKLNLCAIELILYNYDSDDFINISRNLDKNIKFSKFDQFQGITINGLKFIDSVFEQNINSKRLNDFFFDGKANDFKILLGRKNYQVMSIISDELSSKVKSIKENNDLEIFKIATSDDATDNIGSKYFDTFLTSVYDKWVNSGSVYIINNVNATQILSKNHKQYSEQMIYTYNKMFIISLFQKAKFIEFQNIEQKNSQMKHFNYIINKYYFMEVSQEHQVQVIYDMVQEQLKNDKYYEILKDEIEIYRATSNMQLMLGITVFYTLMSLITVILTLILN